MAQQPFVGNPADIHMGPASITYNGKNLGYTLNDSVEISTPMTVTPITPDQSSLPIKDIVTGVEATVTMTLGEVNVANLKLLPGADGNGLKDPVGIDMKAIAEELIVVPLDSGGGLSYTFPSASPMLSGAIQFAKNTPQGLQLTFKVYADSSNYYMNYSV